MSDYWFENVGTPGRAVTRLHERTVALLYDQLESGILRGKEVRVRLAPGGELSGNLAADAKHIGIPDDLTHIGGVIPDLALYNEQNRPVRIIEVVVTNPPDKNKQEKLDRLKERGVDVVVIKVSKSDDVLSLCWISATPKFAHDMRREEVPYRVGGFLSDSVPINPMWTYQQRQRDADKEVRALVSALQDCSPETRRRFLDLIDSLKTLDSGAWLDSLFPVSKNNPKRAVLYPPPSDGDQ